MVRGVWRSAVSLVLVLGVTTGCQFARVLHGEVPDECRLGAGADLEWTGRGHPEDFGLVPPGSEHASLVGDIFVYVETAQAGLPPPSRVFCVLSPSADDPGVASGSTVPPGWEPP
jgi:hypothetical protein